MPPPHTRSPTIRPGALVLVVALALILFYHATSSSSPLRTSPSRTSKMPASGDDPTSKLSVSLKQSGTDPITLTVTVKNDNDVPVTILTWDSPLDPAALALGLFEITPAGADGPLQLDTIAFRRVTPPGPDSLVTIEPGKTAERAVELKPMVVSEEQLFGAGGKTPPSVVLRGRWTSVWPLKQGDISSESLNLMGSADDSFTGDFRSNEINLSKDE